MADSKRKGSLDRIINSLKSTVKKSKSEPNSPRDREENNEHLYKYVPTGTILYFSSMRQVDDFFGEN
jgi:hypothetical protein